MLFDEEDQETTECKNAQCKEARYLTDGVTPRRTMKMLSVGQQVAAMLANPKTRELMKYRSEYVSNTGIYKDYFDGEAYKEYQGQGLFSGDDDVALAMFVDGFTATKSSQSAKLTIIHLLNMNIPPEQR